MTSILPNFSHLYVERRARDHPKTLQMLRRFPKARVVNIERFQEVFNRSYQGWRVQKRSPKLILAHKHDGLLYPCSDIAPSFGHQNFFYNSLVMNCIYDCDYCYLQGMFPSANLVLFVNQEEFFEAVDRQLESTAPLYLCISYDTDLLAMESLFGLCADWIEFARSRPRLEIEMRTKSANFKPLAGVPPAENVILAWTLSPEPVRERFERLTPSLEQRLTAVRKAVDSGWRIRLCFDPILRIKEWRGVYAETLDLVRRQVPLEGVRDASVGVFRMNRDYWQRIKRQRGDSPVIHFPYEIEDQIATYPRTQAEEMTEFVAGELRRWLNPEKVQVVTV